MEYEEFDKATNKTQIDNIIDILKDRPLRYHDIVPLQVKPDDWMILETHMIKKKIMIQKTVEGVVYYGLSKEYREKHQ